MRIFFIALLSIVFSVAAQFCLKAGMSSVETKAALANGFGAKSLFVILTNPAVMAGFLLYGLGAVVWLKVLAEWEVSKAYPMVGLGFALSMGVGLLMGDQITFQRCLGTAVICAGVWMVAST